MIARFWALILIFFGFLLPRRGVTIINVMWTRERDELVETIYYSDGTTKVIHHGGHHCGSAPREYTDWDPKDSGE